MQDPHPWSWPIVAALCGLALAGCAYVERWRPSRTLLLLLGVALAAVLTLLLGCGVEARVAPELGAAVGLTADASRTETAASGEGSTVNDLGPVVWIVGILAAAGVALVLVAAIAAVRYVTYTGHKRRWLQENAKTP